MSSGSLVGLATVFDMKKRKHSMEHSYRWVCLEHEGEFEAGPDHPQQCSVCGSKANGGFGLPFSPVVDFSRADLALKTLLPYEGDNDWKRAANLLLVGWTETGGDFATLWQGMTRRDKARSVAFFRRRVHAAIHKR
jgi:hypothetical protein